MLDKTRYVSIANVFDRVPPKQDIFRPWSRHVLTMLDCFKIFRPCSTKLGLFRLQMCSTVLQPSKIYFDHDRGMFWPCSTVLVSSDHVRQNSVCFDCKCVRPCSTQTRYISTMIAACFDHARLFYNLSTMLDKTRAVSIANVFDRAPPKQDIFRPWSRHVLTMLDCFSIFRPCSTKLGQFRLQMCSTVLHPSKIYFDHDRGMFWPCSTVLVSFDHARQNSVCFDCKCVRPCSTQARYISTMIAACFDHARLF